MPPSTVRVPPALEPLFARAEAVVQAYFADRELSPERGTITISGERYVLVRAASLSVEFFGLVEELLGGQTAAAHDFARNILFDLAHAVGRSDARNFHDRMGQTEAIERLSAGPVHFAHAGWAFVDILPASSPAPDETFYLLYEHPYSFEAEAWRASGRVADQPVCVMNAGYSSGWCEESFGIPLIATEVLCTGCGDDVCRFVMAPPAQIEGRLRETVDADPQLAARLGEDYPIPDLFSRKQLEQALRAAQSELEQRVEERTEQLRAANARLQAEMAQRRRAEEQLVRTRTLEALASLAGGIAQDFNNALTAIRGYADLVREDQPGGASAGFAEKIAEVTERARERTDQLLVFARHDAPTADVIDLAAAVATLAPRLREELDRDVTVLAPAACLVRLDRHRAQLLIASLTANAHEAMPDGGALTIAVQERAIDDATARALGVAPGPKVALVVRDVGVGMDEAIRRRMFEPFFTTKPVGEGVGLGLATVHGIAQQCRAGLEVETAPGAGTTIRVLFERAERGPAAAPHQGGGAAGRVLLVEDEPDVLALLDEVLTAAGYDVVAAARPADAIAIAQAGDAPLAAVVSDIVLPEMSGPELVARLRATRPDLPVIFISGYTAEALSRHGLDEAREQLLAKPFSPGELVARLRALLASE